MNRIVLAVAPLAALALVAALSGPAAAATTGSNYPSLALVTPLGARATPAAPEGDNGLTFTPAPVPDVDAVRPSGATPDDPYAPKVAPSLVWGDGRGANSNGYTPGSTYTGQQTHQYRPGPGVNVSVPIQ